LRRLEMSKETDHHAEGQKDYEKGEFKPPLSALDALLATEKDIKKDNEYRAGYENAKEQDKN